MEEDKAIHAASYVKEAGFLLKNRWLVDHSRLSTERESSTLLLSNAMEKLWLVQEVHALHIEL